MINNKIVTIHQPEHLPWLGFFNKMAKADIFVLLDNVPFRKNYFQNRNKILGTNQEQWIGVPVSIKGHLNSTIKETIIANETNPKWRDKYIKTIRDSYSKYEYFEEVFPSLSQIIMTDYDTINDINIAIIRMFAHGFDINTEFIKASDLDVDGTKSDLILSICDNLNTDIYIAGPFGREYLKKEEFDKKGIKVCFNDYFHPEYRQKRSDSFVPYLSALDLVMNCGYNEGKRIIMNGNMGVSWDWHIKRD